MTLKFRALFNGREDDLVKRIVGFFDDLQNADHKASGRFRGFLSTTRRNRRATSDPSYRFSRSSPADTATATHPLLTIAYHASQSRLQRPVLVIVDSTPKSLLSLTSAAA